MQAPFASHVFSSPDDAVLWIGLVVIVLVLFGLAVYLITCAATGRIRQAPKISGVHVANAALSLLVVGVVIFVLWQKESVIKAIETGSTKVSDLQGTDLDASGFNASMARHFQTKVLRDIKDYEIAKLFGPLEEIDSSAAAKLIDVVVRGSHPASPPSGLVFGLCIFGVLAIGVLAARSDEEMKITEVLKKLVPPSVCAALLLVSLSAGNPAGVARSVKAALRDFDPAEAAEPISHLLTQALRCPGTCFSGERPPAAAGVTKTSISPPPENRSVGGQVLGDRSERRSVRVEVHLQADDSPGCSPSPWGRVVIPEAHLLCIMKQGIDTKCSRTVPFDGIVHVTARPEETNTFSKWNGDCKGPNPACELRMDSDRRIEASFCQSIR